jgi:hypothetical protein
MILSAHTVMKIVKSCEVRFKGDAIYLYTYLNTLYGLFANVPFTKLKADVAPGVLGQNVLDLLRTVSDKALDLDLADWRKRHANHLLTLGFKSVKAFEKDSASLTVDLEEQNVVIMPWQFIPGQGFQQKEDHRVSAPTQPEELGRFILEQRENCA